MECTQVSNIEASSESIIYDDISDHSEDNSRIIRKQRFIRISQIKTDKIKWLKVGGVTLVVVLILCIVATASFNSHETKPQPLNVTIEGESSLVEGESSSYNCTAEGGIEPYNIFIYKTIAHNSRIGDNSRVPEGGSINVSAETAYKNINLVCHVVDSRGKNAQAVKVIDVTTVDQLIFVAGGWAIKDNRGSSTAETELVDVAPGSSGCKSPTNIKTRRHGHSLNILHNRFIICGGVYTEKSCVWSNSTTGPWYHHSTTNSRRDSHSSVTTGGTLHLLGGHHSCFKCKNTMETFINESWVEKKLPYSIGKGSCAVQISTESFIVTGGMYSPNATYQRGPGDKWTKLKDMREYRYGHSCGIVTVDNKKMIIVAGGIGGIHEIKGILKSSELFNIESGHWSKAGDLVKARYYGRIISINSGGGQRLFILGGSDSRDNYPNSIEELSVNNRSWSNSSVKMKYPRSSFGAVAIEKPLCN